jgi:hypothetical protein
MTKLILISGKAEAGKTLTANIIKEKLEDEGKRVTILPFASYLKFLCISHFGWDGVKNEEGRKILQYVGTDVVRKRNLNFWVEVVGNFIATFGEDFDYVISDDVRFPNEIEYFRDIMITDFLSLNVVRLDYDNSLTTEQRNHPSETSLDKYPFDIYVIAENGYENLKYRIERDLFHDPAIRMWLS